jgi:hypothetical protein
MERGVLTTKRMDVQEMSLNWWLNHLMNEWPMGEVWQLKSQESHNKSLGRQQIGSEMAYPSWTELFGFWQRNRESGQVFNYYKETKTCIQASMLSTDNCCDKIYWASSVCQGLSKCFHNQSVSNRCYFYSKVSKKMKRNKMIFKSFLHSLRTEIHI